MRSSPQTQSRLYKPRQEAFLTTPPKVEALFGKRAEFSEQTLKLIVAIFIQWLQLLEGSCIYQKGKDGKYTDLEGRPNFDNLVWI